MTTHTTLEGSLSLGRPIAIALAGLLLAGGLLGCVVDTDSEPVDPADEEAVHDAQGLKGFVGGSSPGTADFAQGGMCLQMVAMDPTKTRCNINQLSDLMSHLGADPGSAMVYDFLVNVLDGHGEIQCTSYVDSTNNMNWCADVVDRYPDGSYLEGGSGQGPGPYWKNFFLAYVNDDQMPMHPDVMYWDGHLTGGGAIDYRTPPVELSLAGYVLNDHPWWKKAGGPPPMVHERVERVLKFDPRECPDCGGVAYRGPNLSWLTTLGQSQAAGGWWPTYSSSTCQMQVQKFSHLSGLASTRVCTDEAAYRIGR